MTEKFVEKKSVKRRIYDYVMITAAACIYGVSISLFLDPNNLAPGGVTGIAVIINRLSGLPTGTGMLLINYPRYCSGIVECLALRFTFPPFTATLMCAVVYQLFLPGSGALTSQPLLAALAGGFSWPSGWGSFSKPERLQEGRILLLNSFGLSINILKQEGCSS